MPNTTSHNIVQLFIEAADANPDRIALIHDAVPVTYAQLKQQVLDTAAFYTQKGVSVGDKALVFVPMSNNLYRIVLALFYIGATPVFVDEWVSVARLKACCHLVECKALIAGRKVLWLSLFVKELRQIDIKLGAEVSKCSNDGQSLCANVSADDTALITFTTGSTGIPKAANRTHGFLAAQYNALKPFLEDDFTTSLVTLPIVVLINLGLGKTTILPPSGFAIKKPSTINTIHDAVSANNVEVLISSPSVVQRLSAYTSLQKSLPLKKILTGGGPVLPDMARSIRTVFPNAEAMAVYGSTEAEPISHISVDDISHCNAEFILNNGLPVGSVDRSIRLAIIPYVDAPMEEQSEGEWPALILPAGSVGEVVVSGPHVLKHYINNPGAQSRNKIVVEGATWHRTGDAGRLDKAGNLYFLGLCKELITLNGKTFYPLLICYAFSQMVHGTKAALLLRGKKLTLVIAPKIKVEDDSLRSAIGQLGLEEADILYIDTIPTDPRHQTKVNYEALREKLR